MQLKINYQAVNIAGSSWEDPLADRLVAGTPCRDSCSHLSLASVIGTSVRLLELPVQTWANPG